MVKIVLCMIVKNESKIIERCILSAKDVLDGICICDTGSTDNTIEVITKVGKSLNIPTYVWTEPFKGFGYNRSRSFTECQVYINKLNWNAKECYALLLDADMCLVITKEFKKQNLIQNDVGGLQLIQKNPSIEYYNMRLVRCDIPWMCTGRTHEYWEQDERKGWKAIATPQLTTLIIDDKNDGGCKQDKFERDIRLLKEELEEDPENVRAMFYLAQSYKDCQQFQKAIKWYRKRFRSGGWDEERWYALYMIGFCYFHMKKDEKAIYAMMEAYNFRPKRSEPVHAIATHFRQKASGQRSAYHFAKLADSITYPHGDVLFIGRNIYSYLNKIELSIVCYYIPEARREGFEISNELLLRNDVPNDYKAMVETNLHFYAEPLKIVKKIPVNVKLSLLDPDNPSKGDFRPMNPSIITTKTGYLAIVRTVNYRQTKDGVYSYPDGTNQIYTKNIVVEYDKDMNKVSEYPLYDPNESKVSRNIFGLEDCRLFQWDDQYFFTCSTMLTWETPQITLCGMSRFSNDGKYLVTSKELLIGPKGEMSCEKNWMPVVWNNHLYLIYSHCPYIRLHHTKAGRSVENGITRNLCDVSNNMFLPICLEGIRGSGVLLQCDNVYYAVVHQVRNHKYLHRFVQYNKQMIPQKISLPFYFFEAGIEYVCSATLDHSRKYMILGLGIQDHDAFFIKVDMSVVKSMLLPVENFFVK